jgi:hypothetical protein
MKGRKSLFKMIAGEVKGDQEAVSTEREAGQAESLEAFL